VEGPRTLEVAVAASLGEARVKLDAAVAPLWTRRGTPEIFFWERARRDGRRTTPRRDIRGSRRPSPRRSAGRSRGCRSSYGYRSAPRRRTGPRSPLRRTVRNSRGTSRRRSRTLKAGTRPECRRSTRRTPSPPRTDPESTRRSPGPTSKTYPPRSRGTRGLLLLGLGLGPATTVAGTGGRIRADRSRRPSPSASTRRRR